MKNIFTEIGHSFLLLGFIFTFTFQKTLVLIFSLCLNIIELGVGHLQILDPSFFSLYIDCIIELGCGQILNYLFSLQLPTIGRPAVDSWRCLGQKKLS